MMRLWKVVLLLNLALAVGVGLGYLRWAREVRGLRDEVARLRAGGDPTPEPPVVDGPRHRALDDSEARRHLPHARGVARAHGRDDRLASRPMIPSSWTASLPGDSVRFTVRRDGERLVLVAIEKMRVP